MNAGNIIYLLVNPLTGQKTQFAMNKNEHNDIIIWVDGSSDDLGRSGCSCWLGDNWYISLTAPFNVNNMFDITSNIDGGLTSTDT